MTTTRETRQYAAIRHAMGRAATKQGGYPTVTLLHRRLLELRSTREQWAAR